MMVLRWSVPASACRYFGVPPPQQAAAYLGAWRRLFATDGFAARWGPRTAERAHPCYGYEAAHECTWNGPSWPFETSKTIAAAINVLREYGASARRTGALEPSELWGLLIQYARAHTHSHAVNASGWQLPGAGSAWIGEALDPDEGNWIVRQRLYDKGDPSRNRGARYLHSTFCDLVLRALGLWPLANGSLLVQPLLPARSLVRFFAIDGVRVRGRDVTVAYDRSGTKYGLGPGLHVLLEGIVEATGQLGGEPLRIDLA